MKLLKDLLRNAKKGVWEKKAEGERGKGERLKGPKSSFIDQPINHLINQLINQSISKSINQLIN